MSLPRERILWWQSEANAKRCWQAPSTTPLIRN